VVATSTGPGSAPRIGVVLPVEFDRRAWTVHWWRLCSMLVDEVGAVRILSRPVSSRLERLIGHGAVANRVARRFGTVRELDGPLPDLDLLLVVVHDFGDAHELLGLVDGLRRARRLVVVHGEMWPGDIPENRVIVDALHARADLVVTHHLRSVEALAAIVPAPVRFVPWPVDLSLARPRSHQERPIDVFNVGRRSPAQDRALTRWADDADRWYLCTTMNGPIASAEDHGRHMASLMSRSRILVTNRGRFDEPQRTGGASEAGIRVSEALASGSLMLGDGADLSFLAPDLDPSPGTLRLPLDAERIPPELDARLAELLADPDRCDEIARHHWDVARRRIDIGAVAGAILAEAGLDPLDGLAARSRRLRSVFTPSPAG
jgi:hypothetical protein